MKPGESKTFIFSFRSESKAGMYFEEWELLTEPQLLATLPQLNLSGIVIKRDQDGENRQGLLDRREGEVKDQLIQEILETDLLAKIESPPPLPPNLRDPEVFKAIFEDKNKHLGLYYTPQTMNAIFELLEDISQRAKDGEDYGSLWQGKIEEIDEFIATRVRNKYSRQTLKERYVLLQSKARKVPIDRAMSY